MPEAGARHERTLESVSSMPLFGFRFASGEQVTDTPVEWKPLTSQPGQQP